jgi:hypothetical protein
MELLVGVKGTGSVEVGISVDMNGRDVIVEGIDEASGMVHETNKKAISVKINIIPMDNWRFMVYMLFSVTDA